MHHLKTFGLLSLSPAVHSSSSSVCRFLPSLQYQQCPAPWTEPRSAGRSYSNIHSFRPNHTSASSSDINYRIGAAFSAKDRKFNTKQDLYSFNPAHQPSQQQPFTGRPASGQDAFFISNVGNSSSVAFGVADGVGGWVNSGVDPAEFSHGLCRYLTQNARDNREERLGARELLEQGYKDVVADEEITAGGSTACVAVGDASGNLQVAK